MSQPNYYFYPAASFPSNGANASYDIEGNLVSNPEANPKEEIPESKPADAPVSIPATVPVAQPTATSSISQTTITNTSSSVGTGSSSSSSNDASTTPGGVTSITPQQAIDADAQRKSDHPDISAVTTSTPSASLGPINSSSTTLTAPAVPPSTESTMATTGPQTKIRAVDSATDPNAVK